MTAIPGPVPPQRTSGGMVPSGVWHRATRDVLDPGSREPQRTACYKCLVEKPNDAVPVVIVMVGGYSCCPDHARAMMEA